VRAVRTVWIVAGLMLGFAVVLAGPAVLVWDNFIASPLNERTLRAEFQSMRYESGGLIFRYTVHNLTRQAAQFHPALTEVKALQSKDRPAVGYPNVMLPLNVPPRSSHIVEVRLELASMMEPPATLSDDQTRRVLQNPAPGAPLIPEAPVSPLPMRGPVAPAPMRVVTEFSLQDALIDLDGFVLVDETSGVRLVLPRGW
jgi:hypothetical protein